MSPRTGLLRWRLSSLQPPTSADQLPAHRCAQLARAGALADGELASAGDRLDPDDPLYIGFDLELWEVIDSQGKVFFEACFFAVDNGSVFYAETVQPVGTIVQFGFAAEEDVRAWRQLAAAHELARQRHPHSLLAMMDFGVDPV